MAITTYSELQTAIQSWMARSDLSGSVTDFIKVPRWPAFNLADVAITVGVVLLLIVIERDARRRAA